LRTHPVQRLHVAAEGTQIAIGDIDLQLRIGSVGHHYNITHCDFL
jgi:hypothetical protein